MSVVTYTAGSGMMLEAKRLEAVSRNLAAANIAGYKREYVISHAFDQQLKGEVKEDTSDFIGSSAGTVKVDHSQGQFKQTGRPLDFVVQGDGFFEVTANDGKKLYTRNGEFCLNNNRELVTAEGYRVSGKTGAKIVFNIDDNVQNLEVTTDGFIRIRDFREGTTRDVGQFKIMNATNPDKLVRVTAKYFKPDSANECKLYQPEPLNNQDDQNPFNYQVTNRFLEMPNGSVITDMVSMIQCNRNFEMNQKILNMLAERGRNESSTFS